MAQTAKNQVRDLPARETTAPKINWDDSQMKSSYANVCNAVGTREEVVLFFGISNPSNNPQPEITVQLSQRVILSPHAAKRLASLLGNVMQQFESRWGALDTGTPPAAPSETVS
jgi:hypothetical protein